MSASIPDPGGCGPGLRPAWLDGDPDEDDPVTARWREAATRWSCGDPARDEYERQVSAQLDAEAAAGTRDGTAGGGMDTSCQVTTRQWFRLPKAERRCRIANFKAADAELQQYRPPGREETETYHALNGRVNDLWPTVPWWWRQ